MGAFKISSFDKNRNKIAFGGVNGVGFSVSLSLGRGSVDFRKMEKKKEKDTISQFNRKKTIGSEPETINGSLLE